MSLFSYFIFVFGWYATYRSYKYKYSLNLILLIIKLIIIAFVMTSSKVPLKSYKSKNIASDKIADLGPWNLTYQTKEPIYNFLD